MLKDYFSRYINIGQFANINTASVIEYLNNIFAHQGIPITFVSNNHQQFVLVEFKEYAHAWSFSHVISSLCIPQANEEIVNQKNQAHTATKMAILSSVSIQSNSNKTLGGEVQLNLLLDTDCK